MCRTTKTRVTVVVVGLASAVVWALFAIPGSITAKGRPSGGGGGNGQFNTQGYWVWFSEDPLGAYFPYGPPPEGSAANGTDGGSGDVVAGVVADPDDQQMAVHGHMTCLASFPTGPEFDPWALLDDDDFVASVAGEVVSDEVFAGYFPEPSKRMMWISADGSTIQQRVPGLSTSGKDLTYLLTINVIGIDIAGGAWDPLAMARGDSATLHLGEWLLTAENPKQENRGCSATGDFSDEGPAGTAMTVSRWTQDEQDAQDACE